jgi:uncharacterized protein
MSRTFIKDPRQVVKPGDIVKVKVLEVDVPRKRIALTLRLDDELQAASPGAKSSRDFSKKQMTSAKPGKPAPQANNAFADALRRASEKQQGK